MSFRRHTAASRRLFGVAFALAALAGCGVGPRPKVGVAVDPAKPLNRQPLAVPAIDAVLGKIDTVDTQTFTATYTIKPIANKTDPVVAKVVQDRTNFSVTIGDVRFLNAGEPLTCVVSTGRCEPGMHPERVSNIIASGAAFYSTAAAQQIRVSAARRRSEPIPSMLPFAGIDSTCVAIPIGDGDEVYCAFAGGVLTYIERADVTIELTEFGEGADGASFVKPAAA